jgi:FkbM family methyltransferase
MAANQVTRAQVEAAGRQGANVRVGDDGSVAAYVMNRFWLHVEPDDSAITPWMKSDGFWEAWVTTWLMRQLRPGDVFVDVGANVGYYTMLARSMGARVLSFEPNPRVSSLLQRSLDEVEATDVVLVTGALGDSVAFLDLSVPVGHSGGASIMGVADAEYTVSTLVRPLDDVLRALPDYAAPAIIKVDAEGAEPEIWRGMQETLLKNPGCIVLMEWESARFRDPSGLLDGIREQGWQIRVVDGAGDEQPATDDELAEMGLQMITVRREPAPMRHVTPLRRPYDPDHPYGHLWSVRLGFKHVPKSAGISLSQSIHAAWGLEYRSLLQVQRSADEEIHCLPPFAARHADLDLWRGRPYVAGHIGLDDLATLNRTFTFTVLREPVVRSLSAYAYLRRRAEDGHTQRASGQLGMGQLKTLELSTLDWFRASRPDDMMRGLIKGAFPEGSAEHAVSEAWINAGLGLSDDEADWLIRAAFERVNVAYLGVDAERIVENLYLQGLLPTLPDVPRLNEAERALDLAPLSYQDLYDVLTDTTRLDRLVVSIATEMFPGYVLDPCQPSFEAFAATARRYGLADLDSGHA